MTRRTEILPAALALALAVASFAAAPPARADLMTACAPEISRSCSDVSRGRGRISACLASKAGTLAPACASEVRGVAGSPLTPRDVRKVFDPGFRAALPAACAAPAATVCPDVPIGDGRIFACLYARSDRVSSACSSAARAALQ